MGIKNTSDSDLAIARIVKLLRVERGMTQEELGKKIGVTFQQVRKYELGRNRISAGRLFEIAQILDVPIGTFFPNQLGYETVATSDKTRDMKDLILDDIVCLQTFKKFFLLKNSTVKKQVILLINSLIDNY